MKEHTRVCRLGDFTFVRKFLWTEPVRPGSEARKSESAYLQGIYAVAIGIDGVHEMHS